MVLWQKDCQPVNDIAHKLMLETNTVTPLLQRMEKLKWPLIAEAYETSFTNWLGKSGGTHSRSWA